MGLNLNVKRVIFTTLYKFDGEKKILLTDEEIRQIAGRAGRNEEKGYVSCFNRKEQNIIKEALKGSARFSRNEINYQAAIFPPEEVIIDFGRKLNLLKKRKLRLAALLQEFVLNSRFDSNFILRDISKMLIVLKSLVTVDTLSIHEELIFAKCPIKLKENNLKMLLFYVTQFAARESVSLPDMFHLGHEYFATNKYSSEELDFYEEVYNCESLNSARSLRLVVL